MTKWHGKRRPGCRLGLPARPALARSAAETWIDSRVELFSIRCDGVDAGLRWLTETLTRMAPRAPETSRRASRRRWITP